MPRPPSSSRLAAWTVAVLAVLCCLPGTLAAGPARADTLPPDATLPKTVSSDALPTVQVDGVILTQVIIGNTVYAGGEFTKARPAGSDLGVSESDRTNLLAYDLSTGVLNASFAPDFNAPVKTLAASPDGKTLYVGGSFTTVGGVDRSRVAAFDVASGNLTGFAPWINYTVLSLLASDNTLYLGGAFNNVKKNSSSTLVYPRAEAAAISTATGEVLPFAPSAANGEVRQLVIAPDRSKVILGGAFTTLNGSGNPGYGLAAVDPGSGASLPLPVNSLIRNAGGNAAIMSLTAGPDGFYGTGYAFSKVDGNLEGTFKAGWDGTLTWVEDCHGDTYSAFPYSGAVYVAGHPHFCGNVGGFPQTDPTWTYHRALAFSDSVTGTVGREQYGYFNYEGKPRPSLLSWFPDMDTGQATGQSQGPWNVTAGGGYVLYGGEFLRVNGKKQQGLVRFALPATALNKDGPQVADAAFQPAVRSFAQGVRLSWPANTDRDNELLTYTLTRDGNTATPLLQRSQRSTFWRRPMMSYLDTAVAPGQTHSYRLKATDPFGNVRTSTSLSVTATGGPSLSPAEVATLNSSPKSLWPLDETSGSTVADVSGTDNASRGAGVTTGTAGFVAGGPPAYHFNGASNGFLSTTTPNPGPHVFSLEAWFRTTSTRGGKILSFGNSATTGSTSSDRQLYLSDSGRVYFGVRPGAVKTVGSSTTYRDGQWHHAFATLSPQSMNLYVDGQLVGSRTDVLTAGIYNGYWRVGGDTSSGWTDNPTSGYLEGDIDQPAVYNDALAGSVAAAHYALRNPAPANAAPTAAFSSSSSGLVASVNGSASSDPDGTVTSYAWTFGDGGTATGATATHTYGSAGTYPVKLTVTDDDGATGTVSHDVTVAAPPAGSPFAADAFNRTVATGFGTADTGGAWTAGTGASVSGGAGVLTATPGTTRTAYLGGTLRTSADITTTFTLDQTATGSGSYVRVSGRRISSTLDYRSEVLVSSTGKVKVSLAALKGSSTVVPLGTAVTLGTTVAKGEQIHVRLQTSGTPTTTVRVKVWSGAATEPSAWTVSATDSYAGLQSPGAVGLSGYLSGSATVPALKVAFLDLAAKPVAP